MGVVRASNAQHRAVGDVSKVVASHRPSCCSTIFYSKIGTIKLLHVRLNPVYIYSD